MAIPPTVKEPSVFTKNDFYIGLVLAVSSCLFIGSSFIIKKKALLSAGKRGRIRAGMGGHGYLREWIWWIGLSSMGIGEAANFMAYAFAPASMVTPLGALSVLVSAILSSKFLNEHLNLLGKLGCFLCLIGSSIIVIHAPKEGDVGSMEELLKKIQDPGFITYACIAIGTSALLIFYYGPRHGHLNPLIYIIVCSLIGSLSVMSCKGLGIAIKETLEGVHNELYNWLSWLCLGTVVTCILVQMNFLNKALDLFNTSIVTPVYYVFFTTFVIIASAILFKEWGHLDWKDILGNIVGFLVIICGIFLLNAFKDMDISLASLKPLMRKDQNNGVESQDLESDIGDTTGLLELRANGFSDSYDNDEVNNYERR